MGQLKPYVRQFNHSRNALLNQPGKPEADGANTPADGSPAPQKPASRMEMRQKAAADDARTLLSHPNLAVLDTETTGLGPDDQVIEIAALDADGNILLHTRLRPDQPILAEASAIHGITEESLRDAPTAAEAGSMLREALEGRFPAAYGAPFDIAKIQHTMTMAGLEPLQFLESQDNCIMQLHARWRGEWNSHHRGYRWHTLKVAADELGVTFEGRAHGALADAKAALAVLTRMASHSKDTK